METKPTKLCISDIKFGKTDAFNELNEYGEEWFKKAFFNYDKYNIQAFISGKNITFVEIKDPEKHRCFVIYNASYLMTRKI